MQETNNILLLSNLQLLFVTGVLTRTVSRVADKRLYEKQPRAMMLLNSLHMNSDELTDVMRCRIVA